MAKYSKDDCRNSASRLGRSSTRVYPRIVEGTEQKHPGRKDRRAAAAMEGAKNTRGFLKGNGKNTNGGR